MEKKKTCSLLSIYINIPNKATSELKIKTYWTYRKGRKWVGKRVQVNTKVWFEFDSWKVHLVTK